MKSIVVASSLMVAIVLLIASSPSMAADSGCERAATLRKHVAESDKMPANVKDDLLRIAAELCPEKPDLSKVLQQGEELVGKGEYAAALKTFQTALRRGDKKTCDRVFVIARSLKDQKKNSLAQAYFGAGLSVCDDPQAAQEYTALVQKGPALDPKGDDNVVSKDVIIRSLLSRPGRDLEADVVIRDRRPREDVRERYPRHWRGGGWYDDEGAPYVTLRRILFEPGSATLTPSSRRQLDILGEALESRRLRRIDRFFVDGHTDSIGDESTNCDLGSRRAKAVVRYLEDNWDVGPGRLVPRSFGELYPIASNMDEEGRRLNRRVVIKNADRIGRRADYMGDRCR